MSDRKKYTGIADAFSALPEITRKHSERVGEYMRVVFAECCFTGVLRNDQKAEARLRDDLSDMAYRIGLYHNVGKAFIPEELHFDTGCFTPEEKALYLKYNDYTQKLIFDNYRKLTACGAREETYAYETICSVHENFDGSGYPQQLEGKKIPVISRILAAVDAFDTVSAMSDEEKPFEKAFSYLGEQSGKLFDPNVVDVMKTLKPNLLKLYKQQVSASERAEKVTKLVPPSGKKTVTLEYRTIDGRDCTTCAIEARPKFRIGDTWTDFDGIAYIFADRQDKQLRADMCLYLAGEACDFLRQAEADNLSYKYILVKFPAAFLRQPGAGQGLIDLLADEEIDPEMFRVNAEASLFTGGSSSLEKNVKLLTSAGIGVMMSGAALTDEPAGDPERVTFTPEQVIASGVTSFRIGRESESDADDDAGLARFRKLRDAGIEITSDSIDGPETRATLDILEVTDFTGDKHGTYTDEEDLLSKETAAKAAG